MVSIPFRQCCSKALARGGADIVKIDCIRPNSFLRGTRCLNVRHCIATMTRLCYSTQQRIYKIWSCLLVLKSLRKKTTLKTAYNLDTCCETVSFFCQRLFNRGLYGYLNQSSTKGLCYIVPIVNGHAGK